MRVIVHLTSHYDWQPVPAGTEVTEDDVRKLRVKPGANGAMQMRVKRDVATHAEVCMSEGQVVAQIVADLVRDKIAHTRHQAVALYLQRHVMPHHAHPKWFKDFEVHDDGPDEELFLRLVQLHVAAGNIEPESVDDAVAKYLAPSDHEPHLRAHFNLKGAA